MPLGPAVFDCHILSLDVADFAQPLAEPGERRCRRTGRPCAEEPDHRHRLLLCTGREWPSDSSAAEDEEITPVQSFTSLRAISRTKLPTTCAPPSGSTQPRRTLRCSGYRPSM